MLSIDAMMTDAFVHADSSLKISNSIDDPEDFIKMTDSLTYLIERSSASALKKSKSILRRVRQRKLYRLVDEYLVPVGKSFFITPEQICTFQSTISNINLKPDDIHVARVVLNFGMKEMNPVDHVLFFEEW